MQTRSKTIHVQWFPFSVPRIRLQPNSQSRSSQLSRRLVGAGAPGRAVRAALQAGARAISTIWAAHARGAADLVCIRPWPRLVSNKRGAGNSSLCLSWLTQYVLASRMAMFAQPHCNLLLPPLLLLLLLAHQKSYYKPIKSCKTKAEPVDLLLELLSGYSARPAVLFTENLN